MMLKTTDVFEVPSEIIGVNGQDQSDRILPRVPKVALCEVMTDDGGYGWGESSPEGHTESIEKNLDELIKQFVGYEAEWISA